VQPDRNLLQRTRKRSRRRAMALRGSGNCRRCTSPRWPMATPAAAGF